MLEQLLDQLDELKTRFGPSEYHAVEQILTRLTRQKFKDTDSLIRYHELLLFLNAYPGNVRIRRLSDSQLTSFSKRIEALRQAEIDLSVFDNPEVSGIAGTSVVDTFTYSIVSWLLKRHPNQVKFDWDWFDDSNRLAETWPRFMPLLDEDAAVEANVPYQEIGRAHV